MTDKEFKKACEYCARKKHCARCKYLKLDDACCTYCSLEKEFQYRAYKI